jgi:hypothetical protein
LLLAFIGILFVFGARRTASLATVLRDQEQRRNLLLRIGGFLAMSAWLHVLPLFLMTMYMREEGLLASEILFDDVARTWVVGAYVSPLFVFMTAFGCLGPVMAVMEDKPWRPLSVVSLVGYALPVLPIAIWLATGRTGVAPLVFALAISVPFIAYVTLVLVTPLEQQIKKWWAPMAVIGFETYLICLFPSQVHAFVATELAHFGAGGGRLATVKHKDEVIVGRASLVTKDAVYLRVGSDQDESSVRCMVRVPINDSLFVTGLMGNAITEARRKGTDRSDILSQLAIASDREHCRSDLGTAPGKEQQRASTRSVTPASAGPIVALPASQAGSTAPLRSR